MQWKALERSNRTTWITFFWSRLALTTWKVSKYGVFSGPYFPVLGLNTERCGVSLRIQSEYGKIRTRKNSVFEHFSRRARVVFHNAYDKHPIKTEKNSLGHMVIWSKIDNLIILENMFSTLTGLYFENLYVYCFPLYQLV